MSEPPREKSYLNKAKPSERQGQKNQEANRPCKILAYFHRWREFPVVPHYWGAGKAV